MLEVIDVFQRVFFEQPEDLVMRQFLQLFGSQQTVARASREAVSINLPARARVAFLRFDDRLVGIALLRGSLRLAKEQQIFRHSYAHLGAVLALLCPA